MKLLRLKYFENINNQVIERERIINAERIRKVSKYYPDKLNTGSPYEILIGADSHNADIYRISFKNKSEAESYFNYIMEKLRVIELKTTPW